MVRSLIAIGIAFSLVAAAPRATFSSKATGTHTVSGPALAKYREMKAELGPLGYPVSDEIDLGRGRTEYVFEHGYIATGPKGVQSKTLPYATFGADGVKVDRGGKTAAIAPNVGGVMPAGGTIDQGVKILCDCTSQSLPSGSCRLSILASAIICQRGTCRRTCQLTIIVEEGL